LTRRANQRHYSIVGSRLSRTFAVLRETLDCFDDGAIELEYLPAFGLVLEQFHHAAAGRRAIIDTGAPDMPRMRATGRGRMGDHRKR
jgi:hypothetical protein